MIPELGEINRDDLGDMHSEEFRTHGYECIDYICDYLDNIDQFSPLAQVKPGYIKEQLAENASDTAEYMDEILEDFDRIIMPGVTHWNHPSFHAYFSITGSYPGMLGEMLSNALNINGMLWKTSPASAELEETVANWLGRLLGLPGDFFGMITDTGSSSTFYALAGARERYAGEDFRMKGLQERLDRRPLTVYCSDQTHSSIEKGAMILGIGLDNVRKIPTDERFRMRTDILEETIAEDIRSGCNPMAVVATIGTTSTTSIDPVKEIGEICAKHDVWYHIDAAYGGFAGMLPEYSFLREGFEHADSYFTNPHKWLFTPIDLSMFYFRDKALMERAFSIIPEYLKTAESSHVNDYMNYGIQLGRRFRSIKLWFVLRYFGKEGIINRLREIIRLARLLENLVKDAPGFEVTAPVPLSTVCFRYDPGGRSEEEIEALNTSLMNDINRSGKLYISHTKLHGKYTLRYAIGNLRTTEQHIRDSWDQITQTVKKLEK